MTKSNIWSQMRLINYIIQNICGVTGEHRVNAIAKNCLKYLKDEGRISSFEINTKDIVAKDPGFNLNIALNSGIEPLARQELNEKLSNSLSELFVGTINNFGNMIQFKKDFGSFEAVFEIHLDPSGDLDQSELEDADESNDMYDSFIILADVNNLKLSRIKTTLNEVQTFILQVLIEKIKTRMVVNPELRKEDIAIQFKEPPKIIQSLRGFDIKEIRGNYEHYTVKAYDNKLVISGVIDENTIEKIDGLIRANLDY